LEIDGGEDCCEGGDSGWMKKREALRVISKCTV
jgi:hypothetical protein